MNKSIINFTANEQALICTEPCHLYSSNKVNYIEARFDLGENWSGYDSIRAVWQSDYECIATVLDSLGTCRVPFEVLQYKGPVRVNLVGSISDAEVLTDRMTTYPVTAIIVDADAPADGDNTAPITPSEYEQFVAAVHEDAERARTAAEESEASADEAEEWADKAEQSAAQAGYMFFHIDENGHLIYERTPNTQVDFYLDNGHLYVEAIA